LNTYKAQLRKKSGFESEATIRDFSITIDEPEKLGGTNKGPNPVEVLLASLGGCLDFTGTIIAEEMGYQLKDFELEIEGDLDPRGVTGKADVPMGFQEIRVHVQNIEGIPEEKIPEFIEKIQKRCPVDNTLEKGVEVEVKH
ncbi:MAG: OsmC family protein, partial [Candidatus Thermoplasmatota archaeon]|nr:OsmC family protein [Candidatus Thermoplasmatota archaeon]